MYAREIILLSLRNFFREENAYKIFSTCESLWNIMEQIIGERIRNAFNGRASRKMNRNQSIDAAASDRYLVRFFYFIFIFYDSLWPTLVQKLCISPSELLYLKVCTLGNTSDNWDAKEEDTRILSSQKRHWRSNQQSSTRVTKNEEYISLYIIYWTRDTNFCYFVSNIVDNENWWKMFLKRNLCVYVYVWDVTSINILNYYTDKHSRISLAIS